MGILAGSGSPQISVSGGLTPVSNPTIANVALTLAATEYSYVVPPGTKRIQVTNRSFQQMRLAYVSGGTNTAWITVPAGAQYSEVDLAVTSLTLYIQVPATAGTVAEIVVWA